VVGLVANNLDRIRAACARRGVSFLELVGSAARDDFDPATSDIDLLVEFDDLPPTSFADAYFTLRESLEQLFGRPVDLVTTSSVENPFFRERIEAERKPVYAR